MEYCGKLFRPSVLLSLFRFPLRIVERPPAVDIYDITFACSLKRGLELDVRRSNVEYSPNRSDRVFFFHPNFQRLFVLVSKARLIIL